MTGSKKIKPEDSAEALEFYLSLFHPLQSECRIDELTRYVFKYCQQWMTTADLLTTQYLAFLKTSQASTNQRNRTYWSNQAKKLWNEQIEANLLDGEESFLIGVKNRLISEYGNKLLNLCPKCGALARTAQSRQCQKCFHSWHDKD